MSSKINQNKKRMTHKSCIICFLLFLASFPLLSQNAQPTLVTETSETIQDVYGNALHVKIHRATNKEIVKSLKGEWKEKGGEITSKKNEIVASGVLIPSISTPPILVLAKVREFTKIEHELIVIFLNGDVAIASGNSAFANTKAYLHELANSISREYNVKHHESEEKKLKRLESELNNVQIRLNKDGEKIRKLRKIIEKEEKKIEAIDKKKTLDQKTIELRKKGVEKVIKSREKINDLEYDITINKENVVHKKREIEEQKEKVEDAKKDRSVFE